MHPEEASTGLPAILVVDDERPIVDLLERYLGQRGFRALGAYSAEEARQRVADYPEICVLVTDVRMPGQSGLALAEELIRDRPEEAAIEVVLTTGAGLGEPAVEAFGSRAFALLCKPFRPSEVAAVVARALLASQQRRSSGARPADTRSPEAASSGSEAGKRLPAALREEIRAALLPIVGAVHALASDQVTDISSALAEAQRVRDGALTLVQLLETAAATPAVSPDAVAQTVARPVRVAG